LVDILLIKNLKEFNMSSSKFEAGDKIDQLIQKLEFVSDSIYNWDTDRLDFTSKHRSGFINIMDEIIKELKQSTDILRGEQHV